jgi:hypothetical protein
MMRAYIGYDRNMGQQEAACLVFANTARQARTLAYDVVRGWFDTEWIDVSVRWLRDSKYVPAKPEPHVIESPDVCRHCELWPSDEVLDDDGLCSLCRSEMEDDE